MATALLEAPTETGTGDVVAHLVPSGVDVTAAIVYGTPVQALCGLMWVPSRNPSTLPLCSGCADQYEALTGRRWQRS